MSLERKLLGKWHNGDLLPEEYMQLMKETKELLAQPEYKREPLGEEESYHEAKRLYEAEDGLWYEDGFVDGLKFAEKMHGIGGGE